MRTPVTAVKSSSTLVETCAERLPAASRNCAWIVRTPSICGRNHVISGGASTGCHAAPLRSAPFATRTCTPGCRSAIVSSRSMTEERVKPGVSVRTATAGPEGGVRSSVTRAETGAERLPAASVKRAQSSFSSSTLGRRSGWSSVRR